LKSKTNKNVRPTNKEITIRQSISLISKKLMQTADDNIISHIKGVDQAIGCENLSGASTQLLTANQNGIDIIVIMTNSRVILLILDIYI